MMWNQLSRSSVSVVDQEYPSLDKAFTDEAQRQLLNESDGSFDRYRSTNSKYCHIICPSVSSLFLFVALLLYGRVFYFQLIMDAKCIQRHNSYCKSCSQISKG